MPPRRSTQTAAAVRRGKRPATSPDGRRRSERVIPTPDPELSSDGEDRGADSNDDLVDGYFLHNSYHTVFRQKFIRRQVVPLRPLPPTFDAETHLGIYAMFENFGWHKFLTYDILDVYPILVKVFYSHFSYSDDGNVIRSWVKGVQIELSKEMFNSWFDLPIGGHEIYTNSELVHVEGVEPLDMLRFLVDDPYITNLYKPSKRDLPLLHQVIHTIIQASIVPHSGGREYVTYFEMFLIWALRNDFRVDLATIVFHHMIACFNSKTMSLPYGLFMTFIFHQFGIDYHSERAVVHVGHRLIFSSQLLSNMGYEWVNARNEWVRRVQTVRSLRRGWHAPDRQRHEPASSSVPEAQQPSQHTTCDPQLLSMLEALQMSVMTGFEGIRADMTDYEFRQLQRFGAMQDQLTGLTGRVDGFIETSQEQFKDLQEHIGEIEANIDILQNKGTQIHELIDRRFSQSEAQISDLVDSVARNQSQQSQRQQNPQPSSSYYYSSVFPPQPPPHGRR